MLLCWHGKPEQRPSFNSLQMDLDDFQASVEQKYDYASTTFMKENQMTDTIHTPRENRRQRNREERLKERRQHTAQS